MTKVFLAIMLSFASASAASAQIQPPMSPQAYGDMTILPSQDNLSVQQVREAMVRFGRCIGRRRPVESANYVADASEAAWTALERKIDDDCALEAVTDPGEEVQVSSNSRDILFALAEVLVQKNLARFEPARLTAAGPLLPADPLLKIGECAVRANPAGAHSLMKTRINSKEEWPALQAVSPAFASCMPKGIQVRFDATTLRGAIAVNVYRLTNAPRATAASKVERGE